MKQLKLFDGEAAPRRNRRPRKRVRTNKHATEIAANRDRASITQLMRCPKLLSASMPRVILKDKYLQRPRSQESEFGLKFIRPGAGSARDADFGKERAVEKYQRAEREKRRVTRKGDKASKFLSVGKRKSFIVPVPSVFKTPCFKPSVEAARKLRDKDASPFKTFDQDF